MKTNNPNPPKPLRFRLYLHNSNTGERKRALVKHAEMLSKREAVAIVKRTKGKMGVWQYRYEPII